MTGDPSIQLNKLQTGTLFKEYALLEQIGAGGQGVVWSALDASHERIVAIKFSEPALGEASQAYAWVQDRQTERLLTLHHPNLLPLYDFGIDGQVRYTVSTYVSGGSLVNWLKPGKFPTLAALRCAAEIASGMDYLHAQGIVHRDLKPGNILLDLNQHAYVTDFGLARDIISNTAVMHTGHGTPPYAPPEQHKMKQMTQESDIYSFGVMLYEFFTQRLPWNGEMILALEQLQTHAEIPDPCEVDASLPRTLVTVLRCLTAAEPGGRPHTFNQALGLLLECFGFPPGFNLSPTLGDLPVIQHRDAAQVFEQSLMQWRLNAGKTSASLTRLAVIDQYLRQKKVQPLSDEVQRFMLFHSLSRGYNEEYWWQQVPRVSERLAVAAELIAQKDESILARCVSRLRKDKELHPAPELPPARMTEALLETAGRSQDPWLRQECLDVLIALLPAGRHWRENVLPPEQEQALAEMALEDSGQGDRAAQLIGRLRSQGALQHLIRRAQDERRRRALHAVQKAAGSLPASVDLNIRLEVSLERLAEQFISKPWNLLASLGAACLGAALGFGAIFYLSYRYPVYLDTLRITNSLVRALVLGVPFGVGIFLTRLLAERFTWLNAWLRMGIASLLGSLILVLAMNGFHILILNTPPHGLLVPAGCLLTAAGFASGALRLGRTWRSLVSLAALFSALAGTWYLHLGGTSAAATPMIYFDAAASPAQVLGMILLAALPAAVLGNLVNLKLNEQA